jgi:phosphoglycerol transferase
MKNSYFKNFIFFIATLFTTSLILTIIIKPWQIDFSLPLFSYHYDNIAFHFFVKTIIDNEGFNINKFVGLPYGFNLFDYPINSDLSYIIILKLFSYISDNVFIVANYFFISGFLLISATSFIALRAIGIEHFIALIIAILYSFLPFHFYWNTYHAFNSYYYIIPLLVMICVWILQNRISVFSYKNKQLSLNFNYEFYVSLVIALFMAISGVYYAYYSCIMLIFVWMIKIIKNEKNNSIIPLLIAIILIISFYLQIPSFQYWNEFGSNKALIRRSAFESDVFGLRLIYFLLPIENHYLKYLSNIKELFNNFMQWENSAQSLGIIGSIGFVFLLLWLLVKNHSNQNLLLQKTLTRFALNFKDQDLISNLASLNILSLLFASAGGLVMFISISFPFIRSHARFSVIIAFLSLLTIAVLLNSYAKKIKSKFIFNLFLMIILIVGIFDQIGVTKFENQNAEIISNDQEFVKKIEELLPKNSAVFELPLINFPEGSTYDMIRPYLISKQLKWSAPTIYKRESSLWQEKIIKKDFKHFIASLKAAGFSGIYIDRTQYIRLHKIEKLQKLERQLEIISIAPKIISNNNQLIFFAI